MAASLTSLCLWIGTGQSRGGFAEEPIQGFGRGQGGGLLFQEPGEGFDRFLLPAVAKGEFVVEGLKGPEALDEILGELLQSFVMTTGAPGRLAGGVFVNPAALFPPGIPEGSDGPAGFGIERAAPVGRGLLGKPGIVGMERVFHFRPP
jgi:hypothetical protein